MNFKLSDLLNQFVTHKEYSDLDDASLTSTQSIVISFTFISSIFLWKKKFNNAFFYKEILECIIIDHKQLVRQREKRPLFLNSYMYIYIVFFVCLFVLFTSSSSPASSETEFDCLSDCNSSARATKHDKSQTILTNLCLRGRGSWGGGEGGEALHHQHFAEEEPKKKEALQKYHFNVI